MLRVIQSGNSLPFSFIVDPSAEFEPGMIAQLNVSGNTVVCGVSDGRAPIGVIDEIRTRAFTAPSWNEFVITPATGVLSPGGQLVTPIDIVVPLKNPNVIQSSFTSSIALILTPRNGIVTFPAGTPLNFDSCGSGQPDSIRAVVNYRYQIPNIIGDDSTIGAGRMAVWFQRMIFETDVYETNQVYPLNANLFVSEMGLLTTRQVSPHHPAIALCIGPPSSVLGTLQCVLL